MPFFLICVCVIVCSCFNRRVRCLEDLCFGLCGRCSNIAAIAYGALAIHPRSMRVCMHANRKCLFDRHFLRGGSYSRITP